jgi:hypothetical protein
MYAGSKKHVFASDIADESPEKIFFVAHNQETLRDAKPKPFFRAYS